MAQAGNAELVDSFEQFLRSYYDTEIKELARHYPAERRSLPVDWDDLYAFDPDLADDYLAQPDQLRGYAEEALRLYDLPIDVGLGRAHVRVRNLPAAATPEIREIRADHMNSLVEVHGIVRKATDVRPKIQESAFECQLCGTLTRVPQSTGDFQEPHECQGCERQGPFRVNFDQSEFVDSQKLRIQESPEGLRGGETPQAIDVHIEDDITGKVTPGDHVSAVGVLRLEQQTSQGEKSPVFDFYMEGVAVDVDEEQFEDMDITEEDKARIYELSESPDIYETMVDSIAPSIYGYDDEKLSMVLQLFSGVTKHLPDGSRIRGDLHMLLIGDPGTGKCVAGETRIALADGSEKPIREIVESRLQNPKPINDGVYDDVDVPVPSMSEDGEIVQKQATKVWKREAPETMYQIHTATGAELEVTPSHPLFVQRGGRLEAVRADTLQEGDFVATPRVLPADGNDTLDVSYRKSRANNAVRLTCPDTWTPKLARLVGYIIAEGYVDRRDDNSALVFVTNSDREILDDVAAALDELGLPYTERASHAEKSSRDIYCSSSEFVTWLENLEPAILEPSASQGVPDAIMCASEETKVEFLRAYVDAEGHVSTTQRELSIASMSEKLLKDVQRLLLALGIRSQRFERANGSFRLRVSGTQFQRYRDRVGFVTGRKADAAAAVDVGGTNTNLDVIPELGDELRSIREALGLTQFDCGIPRSTYQHYERGDRNPSRNTLKTVVSTFENRLNELANLKKSVESGDWSAVEEARDVLNLSQQDVADGIGVCQRSVSLYERGEVVPDGGTVSAGREFIEHRLDEALSTADAIDALRSLVTSDISWDRIDRIQPVEPDYDWVYDLEIAGTHTYVSNGIVSHNSQMLSYIRNIAPRSVYTSGKGSSSAGLTAAAVRDDFGDGQQWSLEAGALVLADRGIAAVDELDKMAPDDRSAMHEALEQQQISVSKAGINATLKSRCSLLGAANPKYGRFDPYEPIGEQIDLEPALVSRFDLIFTVTDQPDEAKDRDLAEHILRTNYAGELTTQREEMTSLDVSDEEIEEMAGTVDPAIDPDLLRKYIAYAKQNCHPRMTEAARDAIQDFYVDLRSKGADDDAPVPVTARQLEALVRLAEASARVRLSDTVREADADRVIEIVTACLQDIGVDPETGEFDADIVEAGTSKSQRDRIKTIKALIADVEEEYDEGAPIDVVLERAAEIGTDESKAQHEIEKLKQKGEVYEPSTNHLRTT